MKCLNCVNYNDKEKICDRGHDKTCCPFFKDIRRCNFNCDFCNERTTCEIHESDIKNKQGYKDYYMRYNND